MKKVNSKDKENNNFERGGRSKEQYQNSAIGAFISGLALIIGFILIFIFG